MDSTYQPGTDSSDAGIVIDPDALRSGYDVVDDDRDAFATLFFDILFDRYPELREVLPVDLEWAGAAVVAAIDTVVSVADDAEALVAVAERLGVDNRLAGLHDWHYAPIGHALVLTARELGHHAWTPRVERAWVDAFDVVAELMVSGAARERSRGNPWISGQLVDHVRVTPDMAVLGVRLDEAVIATPGQHMLVSLPELRGVWRPYHVVPVAADAHEVEFHVRSRRADGLAAALVRGTVGMHVRVGRPQGTDLLGRIGDQNLLAVAVGTGIAPVLALVADPATAQGGRRVQVFYGGRTVDDLAALDRLETIGRRFPRLDVIPIVTTSGGEARLAESMAGIIGTFADWRRYQVITSGPTEVLEPTLTRLVSDGLTDGEIIRADRRAPSSAI